MLRHLGLQLRCPDVGGASSPRFVSKTQQCCLRQQSRRDGPPTKSIIKLLPCLIGAKQ